MHYKIRFIQEAALLIEADDEMQAENTFELKHNIEPGVLKHVIETTPVAVNSKGETFELGEIVRVPEPEMSNMRKEVSRFFGQRTSIWTIISITEGMVGLIQCDGENRMAAEQEVSQLILQKLHQ